MKASQVSYFPTNSPSLGVIVTGPQVSTCPPICSCQEGEPPLKSHFHAHLDEGIWAAQGGLPVAALPGVASSRLPGVTLGLPGRKGREASWLMTEPPETSEKPLPPVFPEAESLVS